MYNICKLIKCKYIIQNYYIPRLKNYVWLAISRGSPKNRLGAEAVQGTGLKLRKPKKGECHLASLKRLVGFVGEVFFTGTCFFFHEIYRKPLFFQVFFQGFWLETMVFPCFFWSMEMQISHVKMM